MNHLNVSVWKSIVRILAFIILGSGYFVLASLVLVIAELLGIIEEYV